MIDFVPPRLPGSWAQVLRRRAPLARAIAEWMPERRWFAGKAGVIERVMIEQVVPLDSATAECALLVVSVGFEGGEQHRYNVPVVLRPEGWGVPGAVIAALDDNQLLYDAMLWDDGCRAVVEAALGRRVTARVRPVGVEQSNSSVIVGRKSISKLIRRLEPGRNPDAELPALLHSNGFHHAPRVTGTLEIALADGTADAVIVHDLIPNHGDLWTWMLKALADGRLSDTTRLARLLGKRTAEMHQALAAAGATTAGITWQRQLLRNLRRELRATTGRLVSDTKRPRRDEMCLTPNVLARFERLGNDVMNIPLMRVHGDLHFGQVLATRDDDVAIIDFEGEPARSMAERRAVHSPLTDLAGLLRSIDYAGRTAAASGSITERRRASWTERTTRALTDAYLASATGVVPADSADAALVLDVYLLQKGLYEIRYELDNRPDWVEYPLAAVMDMVGR